MEPITLVDLHAAFVANNLLSAPKPIYRVDGHGERFYYTLDENKNPRFYGSVTSIKKQVTGLPQGVIDKRVEMGDKAFNEYVSNKAHFGTFWHLLAAELTEQGSFDLSSIHNRIALYKTANPDCGDTSWWYTSTWKGLMSWMQCINDYDIKPIAIEIPLAHPDGYAGTIDLVCSMNDKKYTDKTPPEDRKKIYAIIDWKTGYIYEDHAFQLELNKRCFEENFSTSGVSISKMFNFSPNDWRTKPTYQLKDQTGTKYESLIDPYLSLWKSVGFKQPPDIALPTSTITVGQDLTSFSKTPIADYIKQKHMENTDGI